MKNRASKQIVALLGIALVGAGVWYLELHEALTQENIDRLTAFIRSTGIWAPLVFVMIYYLATLFFLSATVLTILSGLVFGAFWGSVLTVFAATAAAQTAFFLSRRFGGDITQKLGKNSGIVSSMTERIEKQLDQNGFQAFFTLRCLFLPYIPVSYAAGLIKKAKARDFFWATLITNAIITPIFVLFGDSLFKGPKALLISAGLIALVLMIPKLIKKFSVAKPDE